MSLSLRTVPAVEATGAQMHFRALLDRLLFNFMVQNKQKDDIDFFLLFKVSRKKFLQVKVH